MKSFFKYVYNLLLKVLFVSIIILVPIFGIRAGLNYMNEFNDDKKILKFNNKKDLICSSSKGLFSSSSEYIISKKNEWILFDNKHFFKNDLLIKISNCE